MGGNVGGAASAGGPASGGGKQNSGPRRQAAPDWRAPMVPALAVPAPRQSRLAAAHNPAKVYVCVRCLTFQLCKVQTAVQAEEWLCAPAANCSRPPSLFC